jgi:serine/threonine-protein kinase
VDRRGSGAYGVVYLARSVQPEASGFVALKLALHARNERFGREVELLTRIRHPGVPRLLGQAHWLSPEGNPHPFLVMEWVEGLPLYQWAHVRAPSSRQVLRLLAGLARALEATHAAECVHRDVKGDNVLVRLKDGQPFLTDFGSGTWRGAASLTSPVFPPGTPAYRSPEAYRFARNIAKQPIKTYAPGEAEDVFALGVTAYRLVTEQYPPIPESPDEEAHVWVDGTGPRPARALNGRCSLELSSLISRMLAIQPEARGSASELAEALERAARKAGPEADAPLFPRTEPEPKEEEPVPQCLDSEAPGRSLCSRLAAAGISGAVVLGAIGVLSLASRQEAAREQAEQRDAGTVAMGDTALTAPVASTRVPSTWSSIALDIPSKPLRGQLRPDANGRCPHKSYVSINGGCWTETKGDPKDCGDYTYEYKGACYQPVYPPPRPATSSPPESRDGG